MSENTRTTVAKVNAISMTKVDAAICTLHAPKLLQRAARYEAVMFTVFDPGEGDSARGRFTGQLSGAVRPLLEWTVDRID